MPRMILQALDIHDKMSNRVAAGIEAASLAYVVGANPLGVGMSFEMRCVVGMHLHRHRHQHQHRHQNQHLYRHRQQRLQPPSYAISRAGQTGGKSLQWHQHRSKVQHLLNPFEPGVRLAIPGA